MKTKILLLVALLLIATPIFGQATPWNINSRPNADWLSSSGSGKDVAWEWMKDIDAIVAGGSSLTSDTGANNYYVDNNGGSDDGNGRSWNDAFLTISTAMRAAHVNIATSPNYADRNRIYVKGDDFDEDWTDLAQKTDIIGVGSDDGNKGPRILGNHVIDAVATGYNYMGCRFINMTFVNQTAADIFTIPTGHHGIEWIGCRFESNSSVLAPSAIDITACSDTRIVGCEFISSVNPMWSGGAIDFGAGLCQNTDILGNFIDAVIGITIDSSATGLSSRIEGNTIFTSTLTIDDNSNVFYIVNNNMITLTYGKVAFDFNIAIAQNNILTTPVRTVTIPYTNACAGAVAAAQRGAFGTIYYVDGNMAASGGDGLTWETACQSLVTALAKSHANIAVSAQRNWAARNTIYVRGDFVTEDLTKLAQKTDIVGVGSANQYKKGGVIGKHVIEAAATAHYMGCRIFHMHFRDDDAGGILFDIPIDQNGIEFHYCEFQYNSTDTIGLRLGGNHDMVIKNCVFRPNTSGAGFSTAAVQILNGAGSITNLNISENQIFSSGIGIDLDETIALNSWITGNFFKTTGMPIDDESDDIFVIGNRGITDVDTATYTAGFDFSEAKAIDNIITGSGGETDITPLPEGTAN